MVYSFETAVYNTPVGKVVGPIRTKFGYHIIKVTDRRAAQGDVLVAHIMIKAPDGMAAPDSIIAFAKIDEIYKKLRVERILQTWLNNFLMINHRLPTEVNFLGLDFIKCPRF